MKNVIPVLVLALAILAGCKKDPSILAKDGIALAPIVLPDTPTHAEKFAAEELKLHLDKISGANFVIINESEAKNTNGAIYVGNSKTAKKLLGNYDPKTAPFDNIRIKSAGKNLVIAGHEKRGALYATYSFLEDNLGVRWWADDDTFIPKSDTIAVNGELDTDYSPALSYRRVDYFVGNSPLLGARLRSGILKMPNMQLRREIDDTFAIWCHSSFHIIPPAKYFDAHPEWFSEIGGKRVHEGAQLCLTNEEMTAEAIKNILQKLRNAPNSRFVHVSQNDCWGFCECKKCKDFEAAHGGAHSATVVNFANKIGEAIETEFPNVNVVSFAYQYSRPAPQNIKPRKNVWIELCSIECDFAHPLRSDSDFGFTKDIVEWGKITKNLTIWDYVTCFKNYAIPYPNINILADNIRFFVEHGAVGLFEQSDQTNVAGDFVRFRNWYLYHLMWNEKLDSRKLAREFFDGYYAPEVGGFLQEYIDILCERAAKVSYAQNCYYIDTLTWLDAKTYDKAADLMDKALKTAESLAKKNPSRYGKLLKKIRREKISIDYVGTIYYAQLFRMSKAEGIELRFPADPVAMAKDIVARWKEFNVNRINQHETRKDFLKFCDIIVKSAYAQAKYTKDFPSANNDRPERFKAGTYTVIQEDRFTQENLMRKVNSHAPVYVADANASNGCAATLAPDSELHRRFEVYMRSDPAKLNSASGDPNSKKFKVYGYVRTAGKHPKNAVMRFHVFDRPDMKIIYDKDVKLTGYNSDKFKEVDFGTFELPESEISKKKAACYLFWVRLINTKTPSDLIVDRFVLERQ